MSDKDNCTDGSQGHITGSGHRIGKEFPDQEELTEKTTQIIRQINSADIPAFEKNQAISKLKGITRTQMISIIETTGPTLAASIKEFINSQD